MLFMISRPQEEGHYIQCPKAGYYFLCGSFFLVAQAQKVITLG